MITEEELIRLRGASDSQGFTGLCGLKITEASEGCCTVRCDISPQHLNPLGIAHGGLVFTLMDTAAGVAAATVCPPGKRGVPRSAGTHFLRPAVSGRVTAEGRVLKAGRSMALIQGEARDESGELINHGDFEIFYADMK